MSEQAKKAKNKLIIIIGAILILIIVITIFRMIIKTDAPDYKYDPSVASMKPVDDGNEPPRNLYLADSPWAMNHRNTYCQASSPYMGPKKVMPESKFDFKLGWGGLINISFSAPYKNGKRAMWGNNMIGVFKAIDTESEIKYIKWLWKEDKAFFDVDHALSGAYTVLDKDMIFFVPSLRKLYAFGDKVNGDINSDIKLYRTFKLPKDKLRKENEQIVGLSITYDGMLVLATSGGLVCAVSRDFKTAKFLLLGKDEEISNSIAIDEQGGIYIVTSKKMYRVQWTGKTLTLDDKHGAWTADYEIGKGIEGVRLGAGSGATPTLMGTGTQDKFVVITDGQRLMHLVLFWRDKIPVNWKQIPGTKDRRIAAQVPVTFGDTNAKISMSEQSVCVRGYGALVVNNQLNDYKTDKRLWGIILSGMSSFAPYGIEKFIWDPKERKLRSVWASTKISMPNGIPSMSAATNLIYNVGHRDDGWTFEAIDWHTGELVFSFPMGHWSIFWHNSAYAATEIGPGGRLYSGTIIGMMRVWP
jgi:hypothetical protein